MRWQTTTILASPFNPITSTIGAYTLTLPPSANAAVHFSKQKATPTDPVVLKPKPIGDLPAQEDWDILFGEGAWGADEGEAKDDAWTNLFAAGAPLNEVSQ